jgi:hypothetical protein
VVDSEEQLATAFSDGLLYEALKGLNRDAEKNGWRRKGLERWREQEGERGKEDERQGYRGEGRRSEV